MSKESPLIQKAEWRQLLLARRKLISRERREAASRLLLEKFSVQGRVLSFTPIGSEINTTPLNERLAAEGRLELLPYKIETLIEMPLKKIDCILVPGLGFDRERNRIGYGKGHFDRFLAAAPNIFTIGIGFKEQFCEELFPHDPWDIPVQELLLC